MDLVALKLEASRCLNCKDQPCVAACPAHNPIPKLMGFVKKGQLEEAFNLWHQTSYLPELCGNLCQNETLCEGACTLNKIHKPVKIGWVEAMLADFYKEQVSLPVEKNHHTHLVIGLGPAGMANALKLAEAGFEVTAIDAQSSLGGTVNNLVPEFRFDKTILNGIENRFNKLGIHTRYQTVVGKDVMLSDLLKQYETIFIADGVGLPQKADIDTHGLTVYYAQDLLNRTIYQSNDLTKLLGNRCYIIGLGNVAIDMARTLIRLGKEVHIVYRRTIEAAPAGPSEIQDAIDEGVIIHELVAPVTLIKDGVVHRLDCQKTRLVKSDEGRRDRVEIIPDSSVVYEIDDLIFATGQKTSELLFKGTNIVPNPLISPYATNLNHVFIGGDRVNREKRIVDAMVTGQQVADIIMKGLYEIYR